VPKLLVAPSLEEGAVGMELRELLAQLPKAPGLFKELLECLMPQNLQMH
jgi:hypothetical protein